MPSEISVAGAGVFGSWIAYTLQRAGHKVTLVDPYGPAHARASSGGESRIIRCAYGADEIYTRMAKRSLALWNDFFSLVNRPQLFQPTGVLWLTELDHAHAEASRVALRNAKVEFEDLSPSELHRRYTQINATESMGALFEPNAGALMARQAVQAVVEEFIRIGGTFRRAALPVETSANGLTVYACGPWLGKLFPDILGSRIFVTRQEVLFFGTPPGDTRFQAPQLPIWLDFHRDPAMYGFPDLEARGFKMAIDRHGATMDPDADDRLVSKETVRQMRTYLAQRFPALTNAPVVDARVCQYENSSNGDFIIDRHPAHDNIWLVGGGSGHGFKHGPVVAEYVEQILSGGEMEARFLLDKKESVQKRAVY